MMKIVKEAYSLKILRAEELNTELAIGYLKDSVCDEDLENPFHERHNHHLGISIDLLKKQIPTVTNKSLVTVLDKYIFEQSLINTIPFYSSFAV